MTKLPRSRVAELGAFWALGIFAIGCSASKDSDGFVRDTDGGGLPIATGGMVGNGGSDPVATGGTDVALGGSSSGGGSGGSGTCATATAHAALTSEPIDIILALDNSGSMEEEMEAAEQNINDNFAAVLNNGGIDYRLMLLSRHRKDDRDASDEASTSICVSAPLSGLAQCPSELPVPSERFYQYGEKIESHDALDWILTAYDTPPESDKLAALAPDGWSGWIRDGAKTVILVMTDDDEYTDDPDDDEAPPMTADEFLTQFTALDPARFGSLSAPNFAFHSIIGIKEKADPTAAYLPAEPIESETCEGNGADVENAGETYQELSRKTEGLRFPLCQFPNYDTVFRAIAGDVIVNAELTCEFPIPPSPDDRVIELDNVAVNYLRGNGGGETKLGQAPTSNDCQPDAFYIEADQVRLCPEACDVIRDDPGAGIEVLFTCEPQLIIPE